MKLSEYPKDRQSLTGITQAEVSGFPGGPDGKDSAYNVERPGLIPGLGRSPVGGHGNPLQYLALRIPWTEEPGGLHFSSVQSLSCV